VSRTPTPATLRLGSLAVVVLGAVLVLSSASRPRRAIDGATLSSNTMDVPGGRALALAALAAVAAVLLVRGWSRRLVALLVDGTGVTVFVLNLQARDGTFAVTLFGPLAGRDTIDTHLSVWFWLTATGSVLLVAGGALIALLGHRWPSSRRDYDAPAAQASRADPWTALDRGEDPTL
jgi:hypothetical protein